MPSVCPEGTSPPPELTLSLDRKNREKEARVTANISDDTFAYLTLDEAEQVAYDPLYLVGRGRGQEPHRPQLFDSQGRCVTRECVTCHAENEGAQA
ncbi:hypothetical protein AB0L05_17195 [Nonomuraea pusilla]|uniref:hypothetical protein n=1 Tax=Nonomuraea pusilla TaxID=46177 RepID=UPI00332CF616